MMHEMQVSKLIEIIPFDLHLNYLGLVSSFLQSESPWMVGAVAVASGLMVVTSIVY